MAKPGRGRLSSIDLLPVECDAVVAWAAEQLSVMERTQTDIYAEFREKLIAIQGETGVGFDVPSFSSFNRYSVKLAAMARRLDQTREIAGALSDRMDAGTSDELTTIAAEAIKTLIFELLQAKRRSGHLDQGRPGARQCARAAAAAQKISTARRQEVTRSSPTTSTQAVDKVAKEAGLSAEAAAQIRRDILGVRAHERGPRHLRRPAGDRPRAGRAARGAAARRRDRARSRPAGRRHPHASPGRMAGGQGRPQARASRGGAPASPSPRRSTTRSPPPAPARPAATTSSISATPRTRAASSSATSPTSPRWWRKELVKIEEFLFEDQRADGTTRLISAYRVRFASGFRVEALSSRPENIRGLQGIVVIDEAAFHKDVRAVLDAVNALLIWGGKIRVISTHNGLLNPFNELVREARAGRVPFSVHDIPFKTAIENGLYRRVCYIKGKDWSAEDEAEWEARIRGAYGPRLAAMRQELDAIPAESEGAALTRVQIEACMDARPIVRWARDDDFKNAPEHVRKADALDFCERELRPLLETLNPRLRHVFGEDFARKGDVTDILPLEIGNDLVRRVPFMVELRNVPFDQQRDILFYVVDRLPRLSGGALDATGNGAYLAEKAAQRYGASVVEVMLSEAWYRAEMPAYIEAFSDKTILLPAPRRRAPRSPGARLCQRHRQGARRLPLQGQRRLRPPRRQRHCRGAGIFREPLRPRSLWLREGRRCGSFRLVADVREAAGRRRPPAAPARRAHLMKDIR